MTNAFVLRRHRVREGEIIIVRLPIMSETTAHNVGHTFCFCLLDDKYRAARRRALISYAVYVRSERNEARKKEILSVR